MENNLYSAAVLASGAGVGWIVYLLVSSLIRRRGSITIMRHRISLVPLRRPLALLVPVAFMSAAIPLARLPEKAAGFVGDYLGILYLAIFGWIAVKAVYIAGDALVSRYDIGSGDNLRARSMTTQVHVMGNILATVISVLTACLILLNIPQVRHIGVSILASAGILGVVIGFAAQKTLGNFIAGIQIAFAQPIRLDDVVIVENEWGWIEQITLTFVVVRIWDQRRLVVPISYFLEKPFQNWTRTTADILGTVYIYADYTVPVAEVRAELMRILESSSLWDRKAGGLQVTNATEKAVELRALMSAANSSAAWNLRCEVREKLLEFMQKRHPGSLPRMRIEMEGGKGGA